MPTVLSAWSGLKGKTISRAEPQRKTIATEFTEDTEKNTRREYKLPLLSSPRRRGSSPEQSSAAWGWDVMFRGFTERTLSANQLSFANRAFLRSYKDVINLVQSKLDWIPAGACPREGGDRNDMLILFSVSSVAIIFLCALAPWRENYFYL